MQIKKLFDEKLWKFLLVGVLNTLVGNGLMFLLYNLAKLGYWPSTAISYLLASVMSYFLNRYYTFRHKEKGLAPALRFALNILCCYLLAYGLAKPLVGYALASRNEALRDNLSMLAGMILFVIFNYFGQRFFAFREGAQPRIARKLTLRRVMLSPRPTQNLLLSFLLPAGILGLGLLLSGLFPAGDRQILAHDMYHQYFPFLLDFRQKLLSGNSLLFSWTSGMGTNYLPLFAYYLASPLYLFSAAVPAKYMTEFMAAAVVLKIGFAGLSFGVFLKTVFRHCDSTTVMFSTLFALCSFMTGYYWNVMWLDTVALLPLVVAGTICLLRDGRIALYGFSLFFAVWCNYYISYFICIFVVLVFIGYTICYWDGFAGLFHRFGRILLATLLALGMTAILTIPTYLGLQNTYSAINKFPTGFSINLGGREHQNWYGVLIALRKIAGNMLSGVQPTSMEGSPNVACGFISVFLAALFCFDGKQRIRERIFHIFLLLFFCAGFIFRQLDYIWHGFHFTNMLPYRFSFLFSFVILAMAYRAWRHFGSFRLYQVLLAALCCALVIVAGFSYVSLKAVAVSVAICALGVIAFLLQKYFHWKKQAVALLLLGICVLEASLSVWLGLSATGTTTRSAYPREGKNTQLLVDELQEAEKDSVDLYRTDFTDYQTLNDPSLFSLNGVSIFSSVANVALSRFTEQLGLAAWPGSNRYVYYQSSPFTNTLLNVKYVIDREGLRLDPDYMREVKTAGKVVLQKNKAYIPMGFVVRSDILDYDVEKKLSPQQAQQKLLELSTGIKKQLYHPLPVTAYHAPENCTLSKTSDTVYSFSTKQNEDNEFSFSASITEPTLLCAYLKGTNCKKLKVIVNSEERMSRTSKVGCLYCLGAFDKNDNIEIRFPADKEKNGVITVQLLSFDTAVFDEAVQALSESVLRAEQVTDTRIRGSIQAARDGVFYTSIPAEPGWRAWVDGAETEITPVGGAFVAFPMEKGLHTVELRFTTPGLYPGLLISVCCLFLWLLLLYANARHRKAAAEKAEHSRPSQSVQADMPPLQLRDFTEATPEEPTPTQMPPLILREEAQDEPQDETL